MKDNIILTYCFLLFSFSSTAQTFIGEVNINDEQQKHLLVFKNGKEKIGKIISIKNTEVQFVENNNTPTLYNLFEIDKVMVVDKDLDMTTLKGKNKAEKKEEEFKLTFALLDRGDHRLLYSETGFTLRQGEKEFRTIWGNFHTFDYGVIDGYTIGVGLSNFGHIVLHNKFNIIQNAIHPSLRVGFDFQIAGQPERFFDDFTNVERLGWNGFFKISTYFSIGTPQRYGHLSFNIVPVFEAGSGFSENILISFNFGGMIKVAPQWKLIYENTFGEFDSNGFIFGFFSGVGANWFNEKNSIKFAINTDPSFGFFNIPINDLNSVARLPFFSYARYF